MTEMPFLRILFCAFLMLLTFLIIHLGVDGLLAKHYGTSCGTLLWPISGLAISCGPGECECPLPFIHRVIITGLPLVAGLALCVWALRIRSLKDVLIAGASACTLPAICVFLASPPSLWHVDYKFTVVPWELVIFALYLSAFLVGAYFGFLMRQVAPRLSEPPVKLESRDGHVGLP